MAPSKNKHYWLFAGLLSLTILLFFSPSFSWSDLFSLSRSRNSIPTQLPFHTSEVEILREKLAEASWKLALSQEKIQSLSGFREKFSPEKVPIAIPACILARKDSSGQRFSFVLDRGKRDGVESGDPVVYGSTLIGQIWETNQNTSRALSIVDPAMRFGIMLVITDEGKEDRQIRGLALGMGSFCQLGMIDKNCQVWSQAQVLTSGADGRFPQGLSVGTVKKPTSAADKNMSGLFWNLEVKSLDLDKIQTALILKFVRQNTVRPG